MVIAFLCILGAGSLALPWLLRWYSAYSGNQALLHPPVLAVLWACAIPACIALIQLGRLLRNIAADRVFTTENIQSLRHISWCCYGVAFLFLFFLFYYILGLLIAIIAAFMGLILRVVKNVFAQALAIKEENDLTV